MEITDDTKWGLLLGIIHQNRILSGDRIDDPIWKGKCWDWPRNDRSTLGIGFIGR